MTDSPDDIVGHKTFDTGEICPETGFPKMRHEPLTRAEGETLWAAYQRAHEDRVARMPDEKSALNTMHDAYTRLKDMGWRDATYCPKDGSHFQAIRGWQHRDPRLQLDIACFRIGPFLDYEDLYGTWSRLSEVEEAGCVLIRPDLYVAWRSVTMVSQPAEVLRRAMKSILSLH